MLNASYNLKLRGVTSYIPEYPVGDAQAVAKMIADFLPVSRAILGVKSLKIITLGRAPMTPGLQRAIAPLYKLASPCRRTPSWPLVAYEKHAVDPRIDAVAKEWPGNWARQQDARHPAQVAQFEITLLDWAKDNLGASKYVGSQQVLAGVRAKFGFVPCYFTPA
jgi:L-fucose isomerase-like protein